MKKIYKWNAWVVSALLAAATIYSCKDNSLEDFALKKNDPTNVSAGAIAGEIEKTATEVTIPVKITLSNSASKAFQVGLQLNADTVAQLIEDGTLKDVYALPIGAITLPNAIPIAYGAKEATFDLKLSVSGLEHFFGYKVAFAYDLVDPGKGNKISTESSGLLVINTLDILKEEEIHYISITHGGGEILPIRNRQNYSVTSAGLSIPLGISLAGVPGGFFDVSTAIDIDSVADLIDAGKLPDNTLALTSNQFTLKDSYQVKSNLSQSDMDLIVPWSTIEANADRTLAVVVKLTGSSRHVLDKEKDHVVVVIYPEYVMEVDVTSQGTLSVNRDNGSGANGGEGSLKVVDGDYTTKFFQSGFDGKTWLQLAFAEPQHIGAYTLTSANDSDGRDPKDWNLQGSQDGENWVTVDTRKDEKFANRFFTRRFDFDATESYKYYRLNVTNNNGSSSFQLMEWRLVRVP